MARKIRIFGSSLCVLIFIVALIAIGVVSSNTVAQVKNIEITDVGDKAVSFSWKAIDGVDGYYLFKKAPTEKEFSRAATISDPKAAKYTLEELNPYTDYDFYIVAFKGSGDKQNVSNKHKTYNALTLPQSPVLSADSTMSGELILQWTEVKNAAGYEVNYVGGDDKKTETFDDKSKLNITYEDKAVGVEYSAKVRSFVYKGKDKLYSPWSEISKVTISNRRIQGNIIDPNKPMIALTFDDGPDSKGASKRILDVLEQYNAKATFFMCGRNAANNPDNVKRKIELGMEIGNHTYDHEHYGNNVTSTDISKASKAIEKAGGVFPTCFRSPGGQTTETIRSECKAEGMALYYWSLDTNDWRYRDSDKVYNTVMNNVSDGDIILMHEIYSSTAGAVERMVPELIAQGYQLVTCQDLIKYKTGSNPEPGTQYVDYKTIKNNTK